VKSILPGLSKTRFARFRRTHHCRRDHQP
jgi:hypothetical protein